jgi:hypothetical protein
MLGTDASGRQVLLTQQFHVLIDGVTRHGSQSLDPERRRVPTTYYHPSGPLGDIVRGLRLKGRLTDVGIVGLGAGTIAAYGEPGERFTYFEIDSQVAALARDARLFTYLADARAATTIVLGDGRRSLAAREDARFDLLVVDAFSSDAIPVHLLTREALDVYLRALAPSGILVLNLTNNHVDLLPVVNALAADAALSGLLGEDKPVSLRDMLEGKDGARWAILARDPALLAPLAAEGTWLTIPVNPGRAPDRRFLWTDDYASVFAALGHTIL